MRYWLIKLRIQEWKDGVVVSSLNLTIEERLEAERWIALLRNEDDRPADAVR